LFENLQFTITLECESVWWSERSGKTTLLRLLRGDLSPLAGTIEAADSLRIVYFDQLRKLDGDLTLRRALAPDSDSVIYRDAWSTCILGGEVSVFERTIEPTYRAPIGRRAGSGSDRKADARTGGLVVAR